MREELRRKLPRTRGWATGIVVGLMLVLLAVTYLIYHYAVADSPSRTVQSFMADARDNDLQAMREYLIDESRTSPSCDRWLGQLVIALGKRKAVMKDADILGDHATVHVLVMHRSGSGEMVATDLGVETIRGEDGWQLDLEQTIGSVPHQFWTTITTVQE